MSRIEPIKPIARSYFPSYKHPNPQDRDNSESNKTTRPEIHMVDIDTGADGKPVLGDDYYPGKYIDIRV
ncbi:MAG: hypothetical protein ACP5D2_03215 [Candidatus Nanoarchaeia archaeon]